MKLSQKDKITLDKALYEAWASVGSACLEHANNSQNNPATPTEQQIEKIIDRLFQSLDPDLCLYVINMSEEDFSGIIQSYMADVRATAVAETNPHTVPSLNTQLFKKAV
jgi:hypothetical protein